MSSGPGRERQPQALAAIRRIRTIRTPDDVYEVIPDRGESLQAVHKRLQRASRAAGVETVIRRSPRGYYIGLATPERLRSGPARR
jgi:hypothetical protein